MTPKKLVLSFLLLVGSTNADTYAGHIIRKTPVVNETIIGATPLSVETVTSPSEILKTKLSQAHDGRGKRQARDTSGWEGIVSLVCGVLGIFTFGLTSIPAIIFGALGMGRGKKHQGLSLAGLILGIVTIFIYVMIIVLLANAL